MTSVSNRDQPVLLIKGVSDEIGRDVRNAIIKDNHLGIHFFRLSEFDKLLIYPISNTDVISHAAQVLAWAVDDKKPRQRGRVVSTGVDVMCYGMREVDDDAQAGGAQRFKAAAFNFGLVGNRIEQDLTRLPM